jgi:hypothetical protein
MNILLIVFMFLAERANNSQKIETKDEVEESIAANIEETGTT